MLAVECAACLALVEVDPALYKRPSWHALGHGASASLGNARITSGNLLPRCGVCYKTLTLQPAPDEETQQWISHCLGCGAPSLSYNAPQWLTQLVPSAVQVMFASFSDPVGASPAELRVRREKQLVRTQDFRALSLNMLTLVDATLSASTPRWPAALSQLVGAFAESEPAWSVRLPNCAANESYGTSTQCPSCGCWLILDAWLHAVGHCLRCLGDISLSLARLLNEPLPGTPRAFYIVHDFNLGPKPTPALESRPLVRIYFVAEGFDFIQAMSRAPSQNSGHLTASQGLGGPSGSVVWPGVERLESLGFDFHLRTKILSQI